MKEYDREVQKRYERMGKLRADVGVMPKAFTAVIYTFIIAALIGFFLAFLGGLSFSMWISAGCLLVVILMYFIASRKGPVRYSEVLIKHEGVYLLFQVISEKNVIFTDGNYTLEYKNKEVKERPEGILHPELSYSAPLAAEYTSSERKGTKVYYVGTLDAGEKKYVYKVQVNGKFISGFTVDGRSVVFDCINDRAAGLGIPAALADEIMKRGTALPKNDIFLSKK